MLIRRVIPADAAELADVVARCLLATYARFIPLAVLAELPIAERAEAWSAEVCGRHDGMGYVAVDQFGVAGFATGCSSAADTDELEAIYLLPRAQACGLGGVLFHCIAGAFVERGAAAMRLWALSKNLSARRFHECLGGEVSSERPFAVGPIALLEVEYRWSDLTVRLAPRLVPLPRCSRSSTVGPT